MRSEPSESNLDRGLSLLRFFTTAEFVTEFIIDNDSPERNRLLITPRLGFRDVPNNRLPNLADAASLEINLLRNTSPVVEEALAALGTSLLLQIRTAIGGSDVESGSRYATRINPPMSPNSMITGLLGPVQVEPNTRISPWFDGYLDNKAPWIYHEDHGWLYLREGPKGGLWAYDLQLGWLFTKKEWFPWMYNPEAGWFYYERGSGDPRVEGELRAFFEYDESLPGNGQWISVSTN